MLARRCKRNRPTKRAFRLAKTGGFKLTEILLAVCCLTAGLCVGIKFSEKYTEKYKFYKSLCEFNEEFYSEVVFFRKGIRTLADRPYQSTPFEKLLKAFISKNQSSSAELSYPPFLSESQRAGLIAYFDALGKTDAATQSELYENSKKKFVSELSVAENEQFRYSSVCRKTGLIVGLIVFVLIV